MLKILIGVLAALVDRGRRLFRLRISTSSSGSRAKSRRPSRTCARAAPRRATARSHFDLWSRTITVADIAGELAAQPPVSVKIGRFTATGVNQPDAGTLCRRPDRRRRCRRSPATIGQQAGLRFSYQAPRIEIADYAGPAGPLRPARYRRAADIYRFALEHFAAVTAKSVVAPTVAVEDSGRRIAGGAGAGDYTYSGVALRDIKDGKIAASTVDRVTFTAAMTAAGKTENAHRRGRQSRGLRLRRRRDAASCSIRPTRTTTSITAPTGK